MILGTKPARIVRHISSSSTNGDGDIFVDEKGNSWKQVSDAEADYIRGGTQTLPLALRTIRNGYIW